MTKKIPSPVRYKRGSNPDFIANMIKPGEVRNPKGREKGSRSKFAETFVKDFLDDWEQHGKDAIQRCREEDPTSYVKVGVTLLPRDFNITQKVDETAIEALLDQFNDDQLRDFVAGIATLGRSSTAQTAAQGPTRKPDRVH